MDTKSQGINLSTYASEISLKDFLNVVKDVHQSVLPEDVSAWLGIQRPSEGHYSDRVKFSFSGNAPIQEQVHNAAKAAGYPVTKGEQM